MLLSYISRKNSLVIRTQLSVRVHGIIGKLKSDIIIVFCIFNILIDYLLLFYRMKKEKLLSAEGNELRCALFGLKQVFQEDKDLVHAFVALGGLNCLVRLGNAVDLNYQNYILRALGQVSVVGVV